jgi:hypothetical protein
MNQATPEPHEIHSWEYVSPDNTDKLDAETKQFLKCVKWVSEK